MLQLVWRRKSCDGPTRPASTEVVGGQPPWSRAADVVDLGPNRGTLRGVDEVGPIETTAVVARHVRQPPTGPGLATPCEGA